MAQSIISSISGALSGAVSFTATNELTGAACWKSLKIKDVEIDSSSMNTANPVSSESGSDASTYTSLIAADIASLKIIQPARMRITAFCADTSSLENVIALFSDTLATLKITTKGVIAAGMIVVSVDVEQTAAMMSATKVTIELEQAITPNSSSTYTPAQSTDATNYGISMQTLPSAVSSAASLYNSVANYIGSL